MTDVWFQTVALLCKFKCWTQIIRDAANRCNRETTTDNGWFSYPAAAPSTVNYTANALNQYTAVSAATPSYDANGNLTSDGGFGYCYDAENRLTAILSGGTCASPALVARYAFDAQGRRKSRTVGAATTVYVTDADNREVLEYDGTTGAVRAWYAYGQGSNEPLNRMDVSAGSRQTLIPDAQGSIVSRLDSASGALTTAGYGAYGENPSQTTSGPGYTAQRHDPETQPSTAEASGLYYYRARMYSPTLGRFLQVDPAGASGSGTNLYAYVGNDPVNRVDPSGSQAEVAVEAAFDARMTMQTCGGSYDCQMQIGEVHAGLAAASLLPLIGAKIGAGFALGYGLAAITGTKSEEGRLIAGGVGAVSIPGIGYATELATGTGARYLAGSLATGGFSSLGEFGAQGGDVNTGQRQFVDYSQVGTAFAAGGLAYAYLGEGWVGAFADANGIRLPNFPSIVGGGMTGLGAVGLQTLLQGGSGSLNTGHGSPSGASSSGGSGKISGQGAD